MRSDLLPSLIFSFVLLLISLAGLMAGDPEGICGEQTASMCLKAVGGPLSAAVLTLVLTFGQLISGQRQARAADLQVRLAAVPILENEVRSLQALAAFIARFQTQAGSIKKSIDTLLAQSGKEQPNAYSSGFDSVIEAYEQTHEQALRFFDELKTIVIPTGTFDIQDAIIRSGSGFASGVGPAVSFMKVYLEKKDDPKGGDRAFARYKLNTGLLSDAQKACAEALSLTEGAAHRLTTEVQARLEKRSRYLNSLI